MRMSPTRKRCLLISAAALAVLAVGLAALLIGRMAAGLDSARQSGYRAGHSAGYSAGQTDGYLDGLRAGQVQGEQLGRALQATSTVSPASSQLAQDAFNRGYTAGESDAFGSYDGGWDLAAPYLITVQRAPGAAIYEIANRTLLLPNLDYFLCADQHKICSLPRR